MSNVATDLQETTAGKHEVFIELVWLGLTALSMTSCTLSFSRTSFVGDGSFSSPLRLRRSFVFVNVPSNAIRPCSLSENIRCTSHRRYLVQFLDPRRESSATYRAIQNDRDPSGRGAPVQAPHVNISVLNEAALLLPGVCKLLERESQTRFVLFLNTHRFNWYFLRALGNLTNDPRGVCQIVAPFIYSMQQLFGILNGKNHSNNSF